MLSVRVPLPSPRPFGLSSRHAFLPPPPPQRASLPGPSGSPTSSTLVLRSHLAVRPLTLQPSIISLRLERGDGTRPPLDLFFSSPFSFPSSFLQREGDTRREKSPPNRKCTQFDFCPTESVFALFENKWQFYIFSHKTPR